MDKVQLSGLKGKDDLYGFDGDDILEGGSGNDLLRGGAGDDQYLFNAEDNGISTIDDQEGQNYAKLEGFGREIPDAQIVGNDLRVTVKDDILFSVKDFVGHEEQFIGVQAGERFFETDDLLV